MDEYQENLCDEIVNEMAHIDKIITESMYDIAMKLDRLKRSGNNACAKSGGKNGLD